jgi:hypothetical protein
MRACEQRRDQRCGRTVGTISIGLCGSLSFRSAATATTCAAPRRAAPISASTHGA